MKVVHKEQKSKNEKIKQTSKSEISDKDLRLQIQNILSTGVDPSPRKEKQAAAEDGQRHPREALPKAKPKVRHRKATGMTIDKFGRTTNKGGFVELDELTNTNVVSEIKFTTMVAKPAKKWYEQLPEGTQAAAMKNKLEVVAEKQRLAQAILQHDKALYKRYCESKSRRSEMQWVQTVLSKGTLSDKVAAHTLLIQDSPVHNLSSIDALISMVSPKGKKECLMAMDSLRDLFLSDLLKPDEKLRALAQRPLEELGPLTDAGSAKKLLLWHFEDLLKQRYTTFLDAVEKVSFDQVDKMKQRAVACMFHLIAYNPEQEQRLLERLVNKLGDRISSVASRAAHHLTQLAGQHPLIKPAVVNEVERLLYRPNIAPKAQYYALCFLSQLLLSNEESDLARLLVRLYFGFFKKCVHSGEADPRTLRVLLTGVNRAFPYARSNDPDEDSTFLNDQLDVIFRVVHLADFNVSVQALMLLFQVLDTKSSLSDRFFGALYRKLLDPSLEHSHFQAMFLNLIYRALKKDTEMNRIKAFLKRLLQGCMYQPPHIICGVMVLISELLKLHPKLFKTLPSPLTATSSASPKASSEFDDDDEEEYYEDAPSESDLEDNAETKCQQPAETQSHEVRHPSAKKGSAASWVHSTLGLQKHSGRQPRSYDPTARNPLYCGAEYTAAWELHNLSHHHHPSVALFAKHILSGRSVSYPGDPLQDFTLSRFLDRFVYRNPKKPAASENESRDAADSVFGKRRQYQPAGMRKLSVLSRDYLNQTPNAVPPEEKFLYEYLQQTIDPQKKKQKQGDSDSDAESIASDDVERLLDLCEPGIDKEMDFAGDFASSKKQKKGRKHVLEDSEGSEDELSVDLDGDEEGIGDWEDDEEFQDAFKDFEDDVTKAKQKGNIKEEDIEFSGDDEFGSASMGPKRKGGKSTRAGKKGDSFNLNGILASAEEFSHLLDENATSGIDTTSAKALSNRDNAGVKQLKWEMDRDAWIHGRDWRSRKRKLGGPKKGRRSGGQGKRRRT